MRILLDTHALWWLLEDNEKIPQVTIDIVRANEKDIYVSIASLWEVAIKLSIEKLDFDGGIAHFIDIVEDTGFSLLEISPEHIKAVAELPLFHRDPFDRILIAQSMVEEMSIMTRDANIIKYDVNSIW